jgi:hypothetical protein
MHQRTFGEPLQWVGLLFLLLLAASSQTAARAQQLPTASRSMDIFAFGGYTFSQPDYGPHENGVTAGVDFTRYFKWPVVPSLEIRGNYTTGPVIKEKSILFGLRLHTNFKRFHPYADALYGGNKINFVILPRGPTYTYDIASAISVGGGVDIDLVNNFQAKFDFQNQFMNFGPNGTQPNNGDFTLTPRYWTGGVVYRIPFRRHKE